MTYSTVKYEHIGNISTKTIHHVQHITQPKIC